MNISLFQPYLGSVKRDLPPFRLREASKELDTEDDEEKARDFLAGFGASELQWAASIFLGNQVSNLCSLKVPSFLGLVLDLHWALGKTMDLHGVIAMVFHHWPEPLLASEVKKMQGKVMQSMVSAFLLKLLQKVQLPVGSVGKTVLGWVVHSVKHCCWIKQSVSKGEESGSIRRWCPQLIIWSITPTVDISEP